ncbi:6-phosphogluconolactonase [Acidothermus cellulolyticus 11B]|uniref:6-phosphogluconolactonase n=1 Tax=Acidothermus cellulolyticus (strain ATCC 43068 / DSM 8971 / 11B) TaxID=351607 RepID=A0LTY4_ACIC1|nr:6-phosphogluconolactonase [Acidothermus cellulolyticus]ABK52894.1 6-phosphogluconolactonase [Acidothermus cellulolyticus 11B]
MTRQIIIHPDAGTLAAAVAARLITRLIDMLAAQAEAHLALTGGRIGTAVLAQVADSPACRALDWSRVNVWWSDERFVPAGHPDRNDAAAHAALLGKVPADPRRLHPMPAADGPQSDPHEAARRYAAELAAAAGPHRSVPAFDVLLLGVGEDGHVASLFPGSPLLAATDPVVAVRDAPKPPPTRLSLSLPALNEAREIWLVVAGPEKAAAVRQAVGGGGLPAGQVAGRERTLWLIDEAAATGLASRSPGWTSPTS